MSSVEFRLEVYHHNSDTVSDWSYGCPELGLMGYIDLDELFWDCVKAKRSQKTGRTK
jgi:hypothetical protein